MVDVDQQTVDFEAISQSNNFCIAGDLNMTIFITQKREGRNLLLHLIITT